MSALPPPPAAVRAYRALAALLLPPRFRADFAEPMAELFAELHADAVRAGGPLAGLRALLAELCPLLALAVRERRAERAERARRIDPDPGDARMLRALLEDLRYGARSLRGSPAYTLLAVLTLALGIGATTAIFTVVDAVLLRPLEYAAPERLVFLRTEQRQAAPPGTYLDWKESARSLEGVAAAEYWTPSLTGGDRPEQLLGLRVAADYLRTLGVRPLLGRGFLPEEEHEGRARVAVLRHDFWRARFGADSAIVGRTIMLAGEPHTVVGVMPEGVRFVPFWATDAVVAAPLVLDGLREDRDRVSLRVFARLRPGVTLDRARAELAAIGDRIEKLHPGSSRRLTAVPLLERVVSDVRPALLVLAAAVGLVLLLVCANVAHLQLVRGAARERELAVRTAIGATRRRLVQQTLVESLLLSGVGGALGVALAHAGVRVLVALGPSNLPRLDTIAIDARVIAFAALVATCTALLFGAAPAMAGSRVNVQDSLKDGTRGAGEGARRLRVRGALVVSEFALAVVLLVGAGLVLRSFGALLAVDPGFDPRGVVAMEVSLRGTASGGEARRGAFFRDLLARVSALPGVQAAGAINHLPLHGDVWRFGFQIAGRAPAPAGEGPSAVFRVVRPGSVRTVRLPVLQGRALEEADAAPTARAVLVNEAMARAQWPGRSPLGERLTVDGSQWFTVVGVVRDARQESWSGPSEPELYFSQIDAPAGKGADGEEAVAYLNPTSMTLVVRGAGDPRALVPAVERVVASMERDAPVSGVVTLEHAIARQVAQPRFYLVLLGAFAGVALLLAAIGVYGVISYAVARRTREIGIRIALGADRGAPFRLVVGNGMRLAALGGGVGLVGALWVTRYMRALLYGVQPTDPATFAVVTIVLGAVALAACAIPAWRASRTDPVVALRSQ